MSSAVVNKPRFKREQKYVTERIAELREVLEDLIDYLDLLESRARGTLARSATVLNRSRRC